LGRKPDSKFVQKIVINADLGQTIVDDIPKDSNFSSTVTNSRRPSYQLVTMPPSKAFESIRQVK